MTNEEMAAALRKSGWSVEEPITQANCKHPVYVGSGGLSYDGSGYSETICKVCGFKDRTEWGPRKDAPRLLLQN